VCQHKIVINKPTKTYRHTNKESKQTTNQSATFYYFRQLSFVQFCCNFILALVAFTVYTEKKPLNYFLMKYSLLGKQYIYNNSTTFRCRLNINCMCMAHCPTHSCVQRFLYRLVSAKKRKATALGVSKSSDWIIQQWKLSGRNIKAYIRLIKPEPRKHCSSQFDSPALSFLGADQKWTNALGTRFWSHPIPWFTSHACADFDLDVTLYYEVIAGINERGLCIRCRLFNRQS
jgi:hypothetical protein